MDRQGQLASNLDQRSCHNRQANGSQHLIQPCQVVMSLGRQGQHQLAPDLDKRLCHTNRKYPSTDGDSHITWEAFDRLVSVIKLTCSFETSGSRCWKLWRGNQSKGDKRLLHHQCHELTPNPVQMFFKWKPSFCVSLANGDTTLDSLKLISRSTFFFTTHFIQNKRRKPCVLILCSLSHWFGHKSFLFIFYGKTKNCSPQRLYQGKTYHTQTIPSP